MADLDLDPRAMKVTDLKGELKKRGESTSGKKAELIERLELAIEEALMGDDLDVSVWHGVAIGSHRCARIRWGSGGRKGGCSG